MGEPRTALESAGKIENCLMEVDAPEQYDDIGPTSRHVKYVDEKGGPLKQRPIQALRGPCTWNAAN